MLDPSVVPFDGRVQIASLRVIGQRMLYSYSATIR